MTAACAGGPQQQAAVLRAPQPPRAEVSAAGREHLEGRGEACVEGAQVAAQGCPGGDVDGDAIADPDDRCPTHAETYNGFQDDDGCPDELPTALAKFTGTTGGVAFGGGSEGESVAPPPEVDAVAWIEGAQPPMNSERYAHRVDHPFVAVADDPRSTFSIDVDTASYANVRRFLQAGQRPPADAVRVEELINYFAYEYPAPAGDEVFAAHAEVADCPWNPTHRLVKLGLKGKALAPAALPAKNLVFLIDVSGSMSDEDKLPLLKTSLLKLVDTLGARDRVGIVVYAGAAGVVLAPTRGDQKRTIRAAIDRLSAGGSTAGGQGIRAAYRLATANLVAGGVNRVVLATDGDFNVGETSEGALVRLIEEQRATGVFLTVLGFGTGNLADATMEALADKGNGNYAYIDSAAEADKVLVREAAGTLVTIARDVKLQVEFNPARVASYRLIGYENRALAHREFKDDQKDAGEIGAGHTVTAFYEVVPAGPVRSDMREADALRYQAAGSPTAAAASDELLTVAIRHRLPDEAASREQKWTVRDPGRRAIIRASEGFRFAAAVAEFGLLLREAPGRGSASARQVQALARGALGADPHGERQEFVALVGRWQALPRLEREREAQTQAWRRAQRAAAAAAEQAEARALAAERRARRLSRERALAEAGRLPPGTAKELARGAAMLREFPTLRLEIVGHSDADEGGSDGDRLALSRARAEAVFEHLVAREGVDPGRLEVRAAGADEPIDTNATARGRARNRRAEFKVLGP